MINEPCCCIRLVLTTMLLLSSPLLSSSLLSAPRLSAPLCSSTLLFLGARWIPADYREYDHLAGAIQTGDQRSIHPLVRLVSIRAEEGEEKRRENRRERRAGASTHCNVTVPWDKYASVFLIHYHWSLFLSLSLSFFRAGTPPITNSSMTIAPRGPAATMPLHHRRRRRRRHQDRAARARWRWQGLRARRTTIAGRRKASSGAAPRRSKSAPRPVRSRCTGTASALTGETTRP